MMSSDQPTNQELRFNGTLARIRNLRIIKIRWIEADKAIRPKIMLLEFCYLF